MNLFKRIEVWILIGLIGGGIAFVLVTAGDPGAVDGEIGGAGRGGGKFSIDQMLLARESDHARLDVGITYDNLGGGEIEAGPPNVRLITDSGDEVDPYFLAGAFPTVIAAGRRSPVTVKYWLGPAHFGTGGLRLEIRGESRPVKSAKPFNLESLGDGESRVLDGPDW